MWRPSEVCQLDVWQPAMGFRSGMARPGWVGGDRVFGVFAGRAGMLVFSKQTEDLLAGIAAPTCPV